MGKGRRGALAPQHTEAIAFAQRVEEVCRPFGPFGAHAEAHLHFGVPEYSAVTIYPVDPAAGAAALRLVHGFEVVTVKAHPGQTFIDGRTSEGGVTVRCCVSDEMWARIAAEMGAGAAA